jgi:predicted amidohydrolase
MQELRAAAAQFEARDGDKQYNLDVIATLSGQAAAQGAHLIAFHECSISGYTFLENLSDEEMREIAEPVPTGESVQRLIDIARDYRMVIGAGLVERCGDALFNCYAVVSPEGMLARHRKIHEFIHPVITCGGEYTVFETPQAKAGVLTCYDNNLPENARITAMLGAEVLLAPHVTGCLPSPAPGRGTVEPALWHNRHRDPVRCRMEFDGPKGRGWLMKWLPARAWENGLYIIYSNPIGVDGDTIKPGGSMILDPYGEVVVECRSLGDEVVTATLLPEALGLASGRSYVRARRPELYDSLVAPNPDLGPDKRPEVWWQKARKQARTTGSKDSPAVGSRKT